MITFKFAERFKELRLEMQLNQTETAKLFGVTQSTVAKWERGDLVPPTKLFMRIAVEFKTSMDYLAGLTD